jgi:hypothetical protein
MKLITLGSIHIIFLQNLPFTVHFKIISSNNSNRLEYDLMQAGRGHKNTSGLRIPSGKFYYCRIYSQTSTRKYAKNIILLMTRGEHNIMVL